MYSAAVKNNAIVQPIPVMNPPAVTQSGQKASVDAAANPNRTAVMYPVNCGATKAKTAERTVAKMP